MSANLPLIFVLLGPLLAAVGAYFLGRRAAAPPPEPPTPAAPPRPTAGELAAAKEAQASAEAEALAAERVETTATGARQAAAEGRAGARLAEELARIRGPR